MGDPGRETRASIRASIGADIRAGTKVGTELCDKKEENSR